jgi:hypothetical protein
MDPVKAIRTRATYPVAALPADSDRCGDTTDCAPVRVVHECFWGNMSQGRSGRGLLLASVTAW